MSTQIEEMTRAEIDANHISELQTQMKRLRDELREYIRAEEVMIAAGIVTKQKVEQAHEIVRGLS